MPTQTGAALIAQTLDQLGVDVIFGLVGIPVVQIAEEAIGLGIRFIAFRNEQAASYAATAYGYLTGRPGVCLVVGGPGVLHAIAGVGNASANNFPMLLLAGSCETDLVGQGAFQELDAIALLSPHVKIASRPSLSGISRSIADAYRTSFYGRGGAAFVDLPADIIQGSAEQQPVRPVLMPPRAAVDRREIDHVAQMIRTARAPLIIIGKGAAYAQAEESIRQLIDQSKVPFVPTPMGKGVVADSHSSNASPARSTALRQADVVLLLGARLNWMLHFGDGGKWNPAVKFLQVDNCVEELGRGKGDSKDVILGDVGVVASQISAALQGWQYDNSSPYIDALNTSIQKNVTAATKKAELHSIPMTYARVFSIIKQSLNNLSPPEDGNIVHVSEGANTMDISRSVFSIEKPRLRLDAGTFATMGVGLGYAIAAFCAYNLRGLGGNQNETNITPRKKIVCIEGDSAFGFSMAEIETMARYRMDILIFVINNGGIYHGDSKTSNEWLQLQAKSHDGAKQGGLRSTSLGWEVGYEKLAEMCGGKGYLVRTPEELEKATEEGFMAESPVVVNVIIESGSEMKLVSLAHICNSNLLTPVARNLRGKEVPRAREGMTRPTMSTLFYGRYWHLEGVFHCFIGFSILKVLAGTWSSAEAYQRHDVLDLSA